jgi:tRNA nucleotidyltransferase/poly(A) polymerase/DNA topoisomerase IB/2'-5' RNA ligase
MADERRIKYPRTFHLPWSQGATSDDKILTTTAQFEGKKVVVTEKMDGENCTIGQSYVHARSTDSANHPSRDWVKGFASKFQYDIPDGWRLCGENLFAKHSIFYEDLPSYFMLFSIWDNRNVCLSWSETVEYAKMLGVKTVPVLYKGPWDEEKIAALWDRVSSRGGEGYVVRTAGEFPYSRFVQNVAKFVRASHVQTDDHWMQQQIVPNKIIKKASPSRSSCMEKGCKKPPEHECIWAGGRARAWYCGEHYEPWKKQTGDWLELAKERKVKGGEVGKKYGEEPKKTASPAWVTSRFAVSEAHDKSVALMKWLAKLARGLGTDVAKHTYVVGGAVRDFVIDRPIKDVDVVIDSVALSQRSPRDSDWFANQVVRAIPVRVNKETNNYGVALLKVLGSWTLDGLDMEGEEIEIANARTESYAQGGYKPTGVDPSTIEEDVYRRELTYNTLLLRLLDLANGPDKADILDITGCGLRDLAEGRMQCPADPDKTFSDDPSRMIRVIKFALRYGHKLTPDTKAAILRNAPKLKNVPSSHLAQLLVQVVLKEGVWAKALEMMNDLHLLEPVRDLILKDKSFRSTMENFVKNQRMDLLFTLLDVGLPLDAPLRFLSSSDQERLRENALKLGRRDAWDYLAMVKNPGIALRDKKFIPNLAQEHGISPQDMKTFGPRVSSLGREALLLDPELRGNPGKLKNLIEDGLKMGRLASRVRWLPSKDHLGRSRWEADWPSGSSGHYSKALIIEKGPRKYTWNVEYEAIFSSEPVADGEETSLNAAERAAERAVSGDKTRRAWGPTLREARSYSNLAMFDFDGTLFRSWEQVPHWWKGTVLDKGPYSFFVQPEALGEPCVPEDPPFSFWISPTVQDAKRAMSDGGTYTVLITGRVGVHKKRVVELLRKKGLRFDKVYFNPGMSASQFKAQVFKVILAGNSTIRKVELWENENISLYKKVLEQVGSAFGYPIKVVTHNVQAPPKELECGPEDFGLAPEIGEGAARVASRWSKGRIPGGVKKMEAKSEGKTAAVTGNGSEVGLFIPLPKDLASQYPSKGEDSSPQHVTFIYIGKVEKGRQKALLEVLKGAFAGVDKPVQAALGELDQFLNPDSKIVFSRIQFSRDMGLIKDKIKEKLEDAGFEVADSYPRYNPHTTIAYLEPGDDFEMDAPTGSWQFSGIELWGLPKKYTIPFGEKVLVERPPPQIGVQRVARIMKKRAAAIELRKKWGFRMIIPSAARVARRVILGSHGKTACIIAVGEWDGRKCLFKNRDRNYVPDIRIYHEVIDGTEVMYMRDEVTGWCEGLNEHGVGIVNSALAVGADEKQGEAGKGDKAVDAQTSATLRDGERVLKGLSKPTLDAAIKATQTYKGGLKGHTFVVDDSVSYSMEATWRGHDYHVRKLPGGKKHVRTNHGQFHQDAGYTETDGDNYLSSLARRDQAMKALRGVEGPEGVAPAIYGKRKSDREDPLSMIKQTEGMRTTSQMALDLTDRVMYLYLIPKQVNYLGYKNKMPKGRKPKISLKLFEYTDLGDDGEFEVTSRKKSAAGELPLMDPMFSLREAAKQLILLEDHLTHPEKRCMDCIRKHLLAAEAFSEEALALDTEGVFQDSLADVPSQIRAAWSRANGEGISYSDIAQDLRSLRKKLVQLTSTLKVASRSRFAGTWGYLPWDGDGQRDNHWNVLEKVDGKPAYAELEKQLKKIRGTKDELQKIYEQWAWLGTFYLTAESLWTVPKALVKEALKVTNEMKESPVYEEWVKEWKSPEQFPEAYKAVVKDLEEVLDREGPVHLSTFREPSEAPSHGPLKKLSPARVVAKYKSKKEVPTADGKGTQVIYEYGPRQLAQAAKDKAERVEKLRKRLSPLRSKYKSALTAKDARERLTALAVALIDETYERVGNEGSAKEGHFGVTGWRKKHVTFSGSKAVISYTGKSGVKHKKDVTTPAVVKALRAALKGKKANERVFCEGDDCIVEAKDVNAYLKSFEVTAKDLRGLHANEEMRTRLKEVRKAGPKLPRDRKERDKILKDEFKKALEGAAESVGHSPSMLRSSYLVPTLEESFMKDGTIIDKLNKKASSIRVATMHSLNHPDQEVYELWKIIDDIDTAGDMAKSDDALYRNLVQRYQAQRFDVVPDARVEKLYDRFYPVEGDELARTATKTRSEKENEAAENLVKPSPKKKPPRTDLQRRRDHSEDESENDADSKQDKKDRSNNYKDSSSYRVALRHFLALKKDRVPVRRKDDEDGKVIFVSPKTLDGPEGSQYEEVTTEGEESDSSDETSKKPSGDEKPSKDDFSPDKKQEELKKKYLELGLDSKTVDKIVEELKAKDDLETVEGMLEEAKAENDKAENDKAEKEEAENEEAEKEALQKERESRIESAVQDLPKNAVKNLLPILEEVDEDALQEIIEAYSASMDDFKEHGPGDMKNFEKDLEDANNTLGSSSSSMSEDYQGLKGNPDPERIAQMMAVLEYHNQVLDNPTHDKEAPLPAAGTPLSGSALVEAEKKAVDRAAGAVTKYRGMDSRKREGHLKKLRREIVSLKKGDPRRVELEALARGIEVASAIEDGDKAKDMGSTMSRLLKMAEKSGNLNDMLALEKFGGSEPFSDKGQTVIRSTIEGLELKDLSELVDKEHGVYPLVEMLSDSESSKFLSEGDRDRYRQMITDYLVAETVYLDPAIADEIGPGATVAEHGKRAKEFRKSSVPKAKPDFSDVEGTAGWLMGMIKDLTGKAKDLRSSLSAKRKKTDTSEVSNSKERDPGATWSSNIENGKRWYGKNPKGETRGFSGEDAAQDWALGWTTDTGKTAHHRAWDFTPWPNLQPSI